MRPSPIAAFGIACIVLSGCATGPQVISSSPRTIVVRGGSALVQEAQDLAENECKKHKLHARLSGKPTVNQFVFDCIE